MAKITDLRNPRVGDFIQPSEDGTVGVRSTDVFVGKRVLEAFFYTNTDLGPEEETIEAYSQCLLTRVTGDESPFTTIHTTRETLNMAITSLDHRHGDRDGADSCLRTVRDSEAFEIHHCDPPAYLSTADEFLSYAPREISIQEAILAETALSCDTRDVATWDSDFTRYDGLHLYPRNYWET